MKIKRIVIDSIFAAAAIILYLIHFSLPIFPPFLEMNLSMLPIILAILLFNYLDASLILILRAVGKIIFLNTTSMYVGELADLVLGFIIISIVFIFKKKINNKYLLGLIIVLSWVFGSIIINIFINIPLYINLMGLTLDALVGMCSIIPNITKDNFMLYYICFAVIPFNIILSFAVTLVSIIVYSRLTKIASIKQ